MLVDFGKVPNISPPEELAVDNDERIYVLSPALPNFNTLLEIARQGENVYPATHVDDNFFRERCGDATIDTLGQEGTDNKVMLVLGTENGLIRSTLSFAFLGVSKHSTYVDFRDVPADPERIRRAAPKQIRDAHALDIAFAYAVNNFYETRPGQKNEDSKDRGAGAGRREIYTASRQTASRLAVVTGTPTKLYDYEHSRQPSQNDVAHALEYVFFLAKMHRRWRAEAKNPEIQKRLEWGQVAHQAANGAALGDVKIVDGKLTLNFSYVAGTDHKPAYDDGILMMGEHLLEHVPEKYKDQVSTVPSSVRIVRTPSDNPHNHVDTPFDLGNLGLRHA